MATDMCGPSRASRASTSRPSVVHSCSFSSICRSLSFVLVHRSFTLVHFSFAFVPLRESGSGMWISGPWDGTSLADHMGHVGPAERGGMAGNDAERMVLGIAVGYGDLLHESSILAVGGW
jgi:hypothetical protein